MKFTPSINSVKLKKDDTVKCSTNTQSNENNCCTSQPKDSVECPMCREKAKGILKKTFNALVKEEIKSRFPFIDGFYYCETASCKVGYFRDESIITQEDMNVTVGFKDGATPATVCYCFDWTKEKSCCKMQYNNELEVKLRTFVDFTLTY